METHVRIIKSEFTRNLKNKISFSITTKAILRLCCTLWLARTPKIRSLSHQTMIGNSNSSRGVSCDHSTTKAVNIQDSLDALSLCLSVPHCSGSISPTPRWFSASETPSQLFLPSLTWSLRLARNRARTLMDLRKEFSIILNLHQPRCIRECPITPALRTTTVSGLILKTGRRMESKN